MKPMVYESEETRRVREDIEAREQRQRLDETKRQYLELEQSRQEQVQQRRQKAIEVFAKSQNDTRLPKPLRDWLRIVENIVLDDRSPESYRTLFVATLKQNGI